MGRPSCSSCCKVVPVIPPTIGYGCLDGDYITLSMNCGETNPLFDRGYDIYYKIGGGGWKTQKEYDSYRESNFNSVFEVGMGVLYSPPLGVYGRGDYMGEFKYTITDIAQSNIAPYGTNLQLTIYSHGGVPPFWVDSLDVELDVKCGNSMLGFSGLKEIKYTKSKSDHGEYMTQLNCWNFPYFSVDRSWLASYDALGRYTPPQTVLTRVPRYNPQNWQIGDPCPYPGQVGSMQHGEITCATKADYEFASGNPDIGMHLPSRWTITIGSSKGKQIKVVKQLVGSQTVTATNPSRTWHEGQNVTPGVPEPLGGWPREWHVHVGSTTSWAKEMEWSTDITYGGKPIFSSSNHTIYQSSGQFSEPVNHLEFDPTSLRCYTVVSGGATNSDLGVFIIGNKSPIIPDYRLSGRSDSPIDEYINFGYCLTYPFFAFDDAYNTIAREGGFTHYFYNNDQCNTSTLPASVTTDFNSGDLVKVKFSAVRLGPAENDIELVFSSDDFGDVELPRINVVGKQINIILNTNTGNESTSADLVTALNQDFNAPGLIFTEVIAGNENMEIALRPNSYSPLFTAGASDGAIEDSEIEFYHANKELFNEISIESSNFIIFNPYSGVGPQGLGREVTNNDLVQYEKVANNTSDTLSGRYRRYKLPCSRGGMHVVGTPFFQYCDNKIRMERDLPQGIIAEEGSLNGIVEFPQGWPRINPGQAIETFKEHMGYRGVIYAHSRGGDKDNKGNIVTGCDIILVEFRTKRGADKSWIDIVDEAGNLKVGMEVYYPIGSDDPNDQYTIDAILTTGPDLKPLEIRLSGGRVVNLSEVELVLDVFRYGMNDRTYALQLIYLKALSTKEGKDYYNPFKYRVTRIDLVNPDIDIDCTGDEIAGHPEMVDIEVGGKVYYPIGLDVNGNPVVSHKYTIAVIVGTGPDGKPTSVELSNGDVVDVSDIELINEDENPTYITLTELGPGRPSGGGGHLGRYMTEAEKKRIAGGSIDPSLSWWQYPWLHKWTTDYGMPTTKLDNSRYWKLSEGNPATIDSMPMRNQFSVGDKLSTFKEPITVTGPLFFRETLNPGGAESTTFASFPFLHPSEGGYWDIQYGLTRGNQETQNYLHNYDIPVWSQSTGRPHLRFLTRQLPEKGYLFGGDLKLKFYLEEIEGWKNKQI